METPGFPAISQAMPLIPVDPFKQMAEVPQIDMYALSSQQILFQQQVNTLMFLQMQQLN